MNKHEKYCGGAQHADDDLNKCPECGGEADRGHDRCIPPSAYMCSKCCIKELEDRISAMAQLAGVHQATIESLKGERDTLRQQLATASDALNSILLAGRLTPAVLKDVQEALAAIGEAQPASAEVKPEAFLCKGTRFKTYLTSDRGVVLEGLPRELAGMWVALVEATDDCHMKPTPAQQPRQESEIAAEALEEAAKLYLKDDGDRLMNEYVAEFLRNLAAKKRNGS